jgi:hypothetical protein
MANNLSSVFEGSLLDDITLSGGTPAYTKPTKLWIGLCSAAPVGTNANEVSGDSYTRVPCTWGIATTGATSASATGPSAAVTFPMCTTSWGTINGYGVFKASSGSTGASNYMWYGVVSPTVAVTANDTVSFAAAAMTLTMS